MDILNEMVSYSILMLINCTIIRIMSFVFVCNLIDVCGILSRLFVPLLWNWIADSSQ